MVDKPLFNPYASALDGLQLDDPVSAFFHFVENVKILGWLERVPGQLLGQMILFSSEEGF